MNQEDNVVISSMVKTDVYWRSCLLLQCITQCKWLSTVEEQHLHCTPQPHHNWGFHQLHQGQNHSCWEVQWEFGCLVAPCVPIQPLLCIWTLPCDFPPVPYLSPGCNRSIWKSRSSGTDPYQIDPSGSEFEPLRWEDQIEWCHKCHSWDRCTESMFLQDQVCRPYAWCRGIFGEHSQVLRVEKLSSWACFGW